MAALPFFSKIVEGRSEVNKSSCAQTFAGNIIRLTCEYNTIPMRFGSHGQPGARRRQDPDKAENLHIFFLRYNDEVCSQPSQAWGGRTLARRWRALPRRCKQSRLSMVGIVDAHA
jgi:hypothetical protein